MSTIRYSCTVCHDQFLLAAVPGENAAALLERASVTPHTICPKCGSEARRCGYRSGCPACGSSTAQLSCPICGQGRQVSANG